MSLLKSAATVGSLTLVSRVLGFVRDQLIAFVLGTGFVAEAFFVAQRFPNLFRALFAEGAFNNAFVPLFAKRVEGEGEAKALDFAIEVFSFLLAWLIVFSAIAMMAMPLVIYVIAPGFKANSKTFQLTVDLTRICFPYLLFMSLTALQSGVLNSLNRFTAAAAAPILLNVVMVPGHGKHARNRIYFCLGSVRVRNCAVCSARHRLPTRRYAPCAPLAATHSGREEGHQALGAGNRFGRRYADQPSGCHDDRHHVARCSGLSLLR